MIPVSIITPAYNAETHIGHAIRSVLAQTHDNFEMIICDDASRDATASVVRSFGDQRIKLITNDQNRGPGYCRDRAIEAASGRWITVLDSDDAYAPSRLEMLLAIAAMHPGAVIFDEIMNCHDTPEGLVPWRPVRDASFFPEAAKGAREIPLARWISAPRTLVKLFFPAALVRDFGVRHSDVRFGEDLGFALKLLASSRAPLWYLPEPLYLYRLSTGSLSTLDERFSLLVSVLAYAEPLFEWDPDMQLALQRKGEYVRKAEAYQVFFSALMQGCAFTAARQAMAHPWVLPEFIHRSLDRIPYHMSRLRHRGVRRETT